jgi:hypothetical protein
MLESGTIPESVCFAELVPKLGFSIEDLVGSKHTIADFPFTDFNNALVPLVPNKYGFYTEYNGIPLQNIYLSTDSRYPIFGNDVYGDCVFAAYLHLMQTLYAIGGRNFARPSIKQILDTISSIQANQELAFYIAKFFIGKATGLLNFEAIARAGEQTGIMGIWLKEFHQFKENELSNHDLIKAAIWAFGGLTASVALPADIVGSGCENLAQYSKEYLDNNIDKLNTASFVFKDATDINFDVIDNCFWDIPYVPHSANLWNVALGKFQRARMNLNAPSNIYNKIYRGTLYSPQTPVNGHGISIVGYCKEGLYIVSWGQTILMTWDFWDIYSMELYVFLPYGWKSMMKNRSGKYTNSFYNKFIQSAPNSFDAKHPTLGISLNEIPTFFV